MPEKSKAKKVKNKYEIDSVHFHNAVQFERQNELFISTRNINGKKGKEIVIDYDLKMLEIKSKDDHILIPLQSVRAVYLLSPLKLRQRDLDEKNHNN